MFTGTIAGAALCSGPNHVTSMGLIAEGLACDASREPELLQKYLHEISNLSGNLRGIGLMLLGTVCYSLLHALIRYMSAELHPFELAFFRNLFGLLVLLPWFFRYRLALLKTNRLGLHSLRATLNVVAVLSYFYALSIVPLADATALSFTAPIFATLLAIVFLGEVVRTRRWTAILFGFTGTLVVLRPGFETVNLGQMLVVVYAFFFAIALIVTKILGRTESSVTIIIYVTLLMTPFSAIPALLVWQTPSFSQLGIMAIMGILGTSAQLFMTQALKEGDTNVVMPFDFLKMIWAVLFGAVIFGEMPGMFTWLGAAMIFLSVIYIGYRENKILYASKGGELSRTAYK